MSHQLKRSLFLATVEAILLYGCEAWTLSAKEETTLDGCYTHMLRMAMNVLACLLTSLVANLVGSLGFAPNYLANS